MVSVAINKERPMFEGGSDFSESEEFDSDAAGGSYEKEVFFSKQ